MESVHLLIAIAAQHGLVLKQADIKTAFLHARTPADAAPIYVIPPKGFECSSEQDRQVWLLKAWLYGLRLSPKGWNGTFHVYLLEIGFVQSNADPCPYILNAGEVLRLVYVDDILFTGNSGAVSPSRSAKKTPRTKHINVIFHHVRSLVADGVVNVTYLKTELQRADILTKSLGAVKFLRNRLRLLGV